jgi:preprotein translocase subunit SecF
MGLLSDLYYGETNFDFPKWWRRALIVSAVLIVASVLALVGRGLNLGIDFEGGTSWDVAVADASVSDARDVLRPLGEAEAKIQVVDGDMLRIQSAEDDPAKVAEITAALGTLGEVQGTQSVGPSWGEEITEKAIRALVVFFVLLALFMAWRLEWKMALAAILAVVHDIIISVGVYAVFQIPVTPATVVSFLTILGYSLYDTIVVFDKVLELTSRTAIVNRYTYTDIVSHGLNRVLMRSLNTTIMGVLPVLAMLIVGQFLGAETLLDFAVALLVGLIVGAYSSIFIAAPILAKLKEREPRHRAVRDRLTRGAEGGRSRPSAIGTDDLVGAASGRRTPAAVGGGQAATTSSPSSASPSSPSVSRPAPSGTIPPRPRKKKRR